MRRKKEFVEGAFEFGEHGLEGLLPEIWETEVEKSLSDRELKNRNFAWALQNLRGRVFFNKSIKTGIHVSRDGLGEWKTATKSREQILSIKILDVLLEIASYWKEGPHIPSDPNIEKVVYFRQHCRINGKDYTAVITAKVYISQGYHKYYHHYLDDFLLELKK
jgi:hypothetical protein